MNVLLLSMPDSFEHMAPVAIRMPNGALTSLAGNVDSHHSVAVADLILTQDRVLPTVERLVRTHRPDVVGLSVMTFQRQTALRLVGHLVASGEAVDLVFGRAAGPFLHEVPEGCRVVDLGASRVALALPGLARYLRTSRPRALVSALDHANIIALMAARLARTGMASSRVISDMPGRSAASA